MKVKLKSLSLTLNKPDYLSNFTEILSGEATLEVKQDIGELFHYSIEYDNDNFKVNLSRMPKEVRDKAQELFELIKSHVEQT